MVFCQGFYAKNTHFFSPISKERCWRTYSWLFCMIVWKSREEVSTAWESPTNQIITVWKDRPPVNNEWGDS